MDKISASAFYFDLASEATEALRAEANCEIPGVRETLRDTENYSVSHIEIFAEEGADRLQRPKGNYITLRQKTDCAEITAKTAFIGELAKIIAELLPPATDAPVFLCGIGNPGLASDALGAATVARSFPTRHLSDEDSPFEKGKFRPVAMLAPDVMGNTGIETAELIRSTVQMLKPAAVIAVDALATASLDRLGTSFQCTDTGIFPGGGVYNHRKEISFATLGVPVIAIGVPTVIYPFAIVREAFEVISAKATTQKQTATPPYGEVTAAELYQKAAPQLASLAVTPKDIDYTVKSAAEIIASALAIALHPEITPTNYRNYLSY